MVKRRQICLALLTLVIAAPAVANPIDVYIVAGQSNAAGGAWPPYPPGELADPQQSLYNYYIDTGAAVLEAPDWEQVRTLWPSEPAYVSFGVEITFAAEMERRTGQPIAIIKVAQSGSNLHTNWKPSAEDFYPLALAKIQASLDSLSGLGYEPELSGLLWIQGEGDAVWDFWAGQYADNLTELTDTLRSDVDAPNLPITLNMLHSDSAREFKDMLRDQQTAFAAGAENAMMFDPSDLPMNEDGLHYPNESFLELGRRFADLYAPLAASDFNRSGRVDGDDLDFWLEGNGDADKDGLTDGADFLLWQQQLTAAAPFIAVPEPAAAALALVAGLFFPLMTRPRSSR